MKEKNQTPTPKKEKTIIGLNYLITIISLLILFSIIPISQIIIGNNTQPIPLSLITITLSLLLSYYIIITYPKHENSEIIILLLNILLFGLIFLHVNINIG